MNFESFQDTSKCFSVVLFIQAEDVEKKRGEIEALGAQANVKLVVQPCPFEGVEFLYRVAVELPGQQVSMDQDVYWNALHLTKEIPDTEFGKISEQHYEYLVAILEQDANRVLRARKGLESSAQKYLAS